MVPRWMFNSVQGLRLTTADAAVLLLLLSDSAICRVLCEMVASKNLGMLNSKAKSMTGIKYLNKRR